MAKSQPNRRLFFVGNPKSNYTSTPKSAGSPGANQHRKILPAGRMQPMSQQITPTGEIITKFGPQVTEILRRSHPAIGVAIDTVETVNKMLPPNKRISVDNATRVFTNLPSLPKGGGGMQSNSSNVMNSSYGLSKAPNPKPVALNSGIVPNTYSNDYMSPMLNLCSPMHVSNVSLGIPTTTTNPIYSYFINTICFDIQTKAQSNVGFSLDTTSTLSATNLLTAFNAGIKALQVYYFYSSILSYESDTRNKNKAMIQLRGNMTPQLLSDLAQLGRRLEDTPMPPRIVQWIRYMNMNFLSGDSQGSPLLKLGCDGACLVAPGATSIPLTALNSLATTTNNTTFALIRRAIPQWRIGTLYDVPTVPVFDKNFLTIFANTPYLYYNTTALQYVPTVASSTVSVNYCSFNNRLDGVAYAMSSAYDGTQWIPGISQPIGSSSQASRLSFYTNGTTESWMDTGSTLFVQNIRQESYPTPSPITLTAAQVSTPHLPGSDKCQGVSQSSLTQTAQNTLDFLFNVEAIPLSGKLSSFNRRGNNRI